MECLVKCDRKERLQVVTEEMRREMMATKKDVREFWLMGVDGGRGNG
jgi:hypothetical protein